LRSTNNLNKQGAAAGHYVQPEAFAMNKEEEENLLGNYLS